jgi:hypothetical protein
MLSEELPHPVYEYSEVENEVNTFSFQTITGILYEIVFVPTPYLLGEDSVFAPHSFELVVRVSQNPTRQRPPFDRQTARTVAAIFEDFYQRSEYHVILYICDSSDGRQALRKGNPYLKIDDEIRDSDGTAYPISLILRKQNPHKIQIIEAFLLVTVAANDK